MESIFIILDGPPDHEPPRFIEFENEQGQSVNAGDWVELADRGYWALKLPRLSRLTGARATRTP